MKTTWSRIVRLSLFCSAGAAHAGAGSDEATPNQRIFSLYKKKHDALQRTLLQTSDKMHAVTR